MSHYERYAHEPCAMPGCSKPRHRAKSGRCHTTYCIEHYSNHSAGYRESDRLVPADAADEEIESCMIEGLIRKEIADRMGMSMSPVDRAIRRILARAGVRTQLQLLAQEIKRLKGTKE